MAYETAKISFSVEYYYEDTGSMPSDDELLVAYQDLKEYIENDEILTVGAYSITFETGSEGGGDE